MPPVVLIGLPTDCNSSFMRGAAKAPPAIRAALFSDASNLAAESGCDLGDPRLFRDEGDAALAEHPGDFDLIRGRAAAAMSEGKAIFVGGDHFVTWPIMLGVKQARTLSPHLIHIDAHPDLYPDFRGNPRSHASPMARIMEQELAASLMQIGLRTVNQIQRDQIARFCVRAFSARRLPEALRALPDGPVYISIDLDGLDPAFAPGVAHPEPGGLSVRDVLDIIDAVPGPVIGADIVELNPDRDINGVTAAVAAKFIKELVGRMAEET